MGDVLKAPVVFGISANLSSQLGIVPMSDNHGNQTQGMSLNLRRPEACYLIF